MFDVILIIIGLFIVSKWFSGFEKKGERLARALKEAHDEIEKSGQTDIVFWSPTKR